MTNTQHVGSAKMKLVWSAKHYWQSVLHDINHLDQEPITVWKEMKLRSTEKSSYPTSLRFESCLHHVEIL